MTGMLWREHETTSRKQRLSLRRQRRRPTQADLLLEKLREARGQSRALELPVIMALGIAQHGARFKELRDRGFVVENEQDRDLDGVVRSRYWLLFDAERDLPESETAR